MRQRRAGIRQVRAAGFQSEGHGPRGHTPEKTRERSLHDDLRRKKNPFRLLAGWSRRL